MKRILLRTAFVCVLFALVAAVEFYLHPLSFMLRCAYLGEALGGMESRTLTVQGRPMHYLATGPKSGPVVVLVHGLGGSAEDWLQLAPRLSHAGFRVYMPDLFGYGRSARPADFSYSPRAEAEAVTGFLDAMHLARVNLGGWSMGGWIVQLIASEHPERIQKLVLFDSAGLYQPPTWNTQLFIPTTPEELDQLEALLMPHPKQAPAFVVRDILRFSHERAWIIQRALNSMLTGQETTDALLPRLKMPVLIVWGTDDRIFPETQAEKMHTLTPHSEVVLASGCGHLAPRQCVGAFAPQLEAFLQH